MAKILRVLLLSTLLAVSLCSCSSAADNKLTTARKGAQQAMKTYYLGRFAIDVPAEFKLAVQSQELQYAEISEIEWPNNISREEARRKIWEAEIAGINKLRCPKGVGKVIARSQNIKNIGQWCKGALYYGNYMSSEDGYWRILIDAGPIGIKITLKGLIQYEEEMLADIIGIANAYKYLGSDIDNKLFKLNGFYLQKGIIDLPYVEQEKTYARFNGPMEMVLRIEMEETHEVEEAGVMDRLVASLAVNFAPGVDVDKIRTGWRTIAGLAGQEIIAGISDKNGKEYFFAWDYQGKKDSGIHPEIKIGIVCPDGNLDEMLKIWDKTIGSFRHVSRSNNPTGIL